MTRRATIPIDLVINILSRLPAKSIARFRCVSKLWGSMLLSPYFTDLYLTNSSPRLLFAVERFDDWCFLTCPHPQNPDNKPRSLTPDFHMKFPREFCGRLEFRGRRRLALEFRGLEFCGHASGFILFRRRVYISEEVDDTMPLLGICNPTTGQYASLPTPKLAGRVSWRSFLGFDPIDKQFKLLSITVQLDQEKQEPAQILTLGTGNDSWRKIHCPLNHFPVGLGQGICINGVLYYLATQKSPSPYLIVCFDVRSEKFKFICKDYKWYHTKLVNYKGGLGLISFEYGPSSRYPDRHLCLKLRMWAIKDVKNLESEWLECFSFCWEDDDFLDKRNFSVVGLTAAGEIVLSNDHASEPFYVVYINAEKNTIQKVEIKGLGANLFNCRYESAVFADYVENLSFITMMETTKCNSVTTLTSSKASHLQQNGRTTFESINKCDSLRLLFDDDDDDDE